MAEKIMSSSPESTLPKAIGTLHCHTKEQVKIVITNPAKISRSLSQNQSEDPRFPQFPLSFDCVDLFSPECVITDIGRYKREYRQMINNIFCRC